MTQHIPTVARLLIGLVFIAAFIADVTGKVQPPEPEAAQAFMDMLGSSGLLYLVKILELAGGLALLSGFFVPLALLVLAPIIVNIAFFHGALDPSGSVFSVVLIALWVVAASAHRAVFMPLLQAKRRDA